VLQLLHYISVLIGRFALFVQVVLIQIYPTGYLPRVPVLTVGLAVRIQ
jgi:hypothetical protein